jgi:hypothetical protein
MILLALALKPTFVAAQAYKAGFFPRRSPAHFSFDLPYLEKLFTGKPAACHSLNPPAFKESKPSSFKNSETRPERWPERQ